MKRWLIFCKKTGCLFCSFLLFGIISSCEVVSEDFPYFIKKFSWVLESKQDVFSNCGVSFIFCNVSEKEISEVQVAFTVFEDKSGGNPFISSNFVEASFSGSIKSGEEKSFEISLDEKMNYQPKSPLYVDYFFVKSIKFADGTEWKDSFGLFAISGVENE